METDPTVLLRPWNFANDYLEYLGENEAKCIMALAYESGP
jgi:hypothetical protein